MLIIDATKLVDTLAEDVTKYNEEADKAYKEGNYPMHSFYSAISCSLSLTMKAVGKSVKVD